jgi:EmrB/QacA subfamily drug resistance transporter
MPHAQKRPPTVTGRDGGLAVAYQPPHPDPKRWLVLALIAVGQLMIVLDASIVNIALPQAQHALNISDADRQWVVTAYTLTFGGLLLLGGRVADFLGRKRVFITGLVGFALASALGGLAPDSAVLFGARALQGGFAAVMAPAALSLLAVTFTERKERATAFSVYGGISGGGAAIGLILGGMLTQYASWRWCLLVNVPVALITAACALRLVRESRAEGTAHYDIPGAVTVTLGLVGLVYGFTEAETDGWGSATTLAFLVAAVMLLAAFVAIEARSQHPLLPLRVVLERNRAGAFTAALLSGTGLFGMFLFLTYYLQGTLRYSPLKSGFAFLPFSVGIVIGAGLTSQLLPRFGPRNLLAPGLLLAAGGLLWFTRIGANPSYALHVLPAEIVVSIGMGPVFVTVASTALVGVADRDAGVASALVNTSQQVGGSLGTALLNTIAATATANYLITHHGAVQASSCTVTGWPSRSAPSCSPSASWPLSCSSGPAATTCPIPTRQANHYEGQSSVTANRVRSPRST